MKIMEREEVDPRQAYETTCLLEEMTDADLKELRSFMHTPLGRKLYSKFMQHADNLRTSVSVANLLTDDGIRAATKTQGRMLGVYDVLDTLWNLSQYKSGEDA